MEIEIQCKPYRDVQTLLFCKLAPTPPKPDPSSEEICDGLYRDIFNAPLSDDEEMQPRNESAVRAYLTFGGYDGICVYPPELNDDEDGWLHDIYRDKQNIIRKRSDNIMYHQMHLVSQHEDTREIWTVSDEDYPFFLATLIYGVNVDDLENRVKQEKKEAEEEAGTIPDGPNCTECSRYEQMIRLHLRQKIRRNPVDVKYAVYNGITVSDVVILWRAKDLREIMDLITYIEYSGIARKSLTTLGFPISHDGQVKSCVIESLVRNLHKDITVCMHGAIRDVRKFLKLQEILSEPRPRNHPTAVAIRTKLMEIARCAYGDENSKEDLVRILSDVQAQEDVKEAEKEASVDAFVQALEPALDKALDNLCCALPRRIWSQSLGKNDFTVSARVSYANLANLLEAYRHQHKNFYEACWEILTDVRKEQPSDYQDWFSASKLPTEILSKLYVDFQELYRSGHELNLKQFSWADALQELLGSHHYVDYHPVLHGPSYLVYTSLKIAYAYFSGRVKDFETLEQRRRLLKRSEDNIIHFIQNLDHLTEQISRNDDAMLNNRSNAHTIHFSLPESALEFYHAFLRRIVDYLMRYDERDNRKPVDFEYDFLLSPKTCISFQFRPMLRTEHSDHDYRSDKIWPHKQAYVLEMPLERIFKPMHIFFPVVHECFHVFGDVLRQRAFRRQCMALFVSSNLLNAAGFGYQKDQDLSKALAKLIHARVATDTGDYLTSTWQQLKRNTYRLFEPENQHELEPEFLRVESDDILQRWEIVRKKLSTINISTSASVEKTTVTDAILNNCYVYFKECYADAMAIATLRLHPDEYLKCSREYFSRFHNQHLNPNPQVTDAPKKLEGDVVVQALRYAVVLAACCMRNKYLKEFSVVTCTKAINEFRIIRDDTESEESFVKFSEALLEAFNSLMNPNIPMSSGSSLHPPGTLKYVICYLTASIDLLYQNPPTLEDPQEAEEDQGEKNPLSEYRLDNLSSDFDHIIRQHNMFGKAFYDIIYNYHEKIRDETDLERTKNSKNRQ